MASPLLALVAPPPSGPPTTTRVARVLYRTVAALAAAVFSLRLTTAAVTSAGSIAHEMLTLVVCWLVSGRIADPAMLPSPTEAFP